MRSLINPANLLGLLILICGIYSYTYSLKKPSLNFAETLLADTQGVLIKERITLVMYSPNASNTQLVRNIETLETTVGFNDNRRLENILATLKSKYLLWPRNLELPQVFVSDFTSGEPIVILNFAVKTPPAISIVQEQALLRSIKETLQRSGFKHQNRKELNQIHILVNGGTSPTFLGHVALPSRLD